ncbi:type VII secretion-associated serine protease mycosin [Planosporangium flavigriseum]|uniref:Type VII secretion-associated serine protease n=1 Tax=Planosporangium flavigriseum TaxID=373681 RepID=A0A8J3PLY7_9ACTN|nr:type VII secretion-associated serine protease [Planosporangium flavigriseum]
MALACVVAAVVVAAGVATPAYADAIRDEQYQLRALDVATAWQSANGAGVTVAVLDSGVDATHPDLAGQVLPGADFVDGSTDGRRDLVGHGTTVAALIAGRNDKSSGVAGIAPAAKILPVRVLDKQNKYDDATVVAAGLRWAVDHGATVVNMSLGGGTRSEALAEALTYAAQRDVVVIACTGNVTAGANYTEVWYPAREPGVVAVAGLVGTPASGAPATGGTAAGGGSGGGADALWTGSLTGPPTVLTAPAVNLIGARPGGYWRVQGTSFAAPLVAGVAALVRSRWPSLDTANVINRLIRTARDLGPPGRDDRYGYGEINPVGALTASVPVIRRNPLVALKEPPAVQRFSERVPPARASDTGGVWVTPLRVMFSAAVGLATFTLMLVAGLVAARRFIRPRA